MKTTIIGLLFMLSTPLLASTGEALSLPDTLLTIDNIYNYTFTDYDKSLEITRLMRERKMEAPFKLDMAEGDLYFNNGKYHQALRFYQRASESDSVMLDDERNMKVLHRFISCYDCLHNEVKKAEYIDKLLQKARNAGDPVMESIARFNMGKMIYDQKDKKRGYYLMHKAIKQMENSDFEYKNDNLIYDYNTLYIMQQRDQQFEEALITLDKLAQVIAETTDEDFNMEGIYRKELKTMYAHRAFVLQKLNREQEAAEAYEKWKEMGSINDKENYLIISYLMSIGRYNEVISMNRIREDFLRNHNDTINYHMVTMKRTTGRAYEAMGNYKAAAKYFNDLAILTDSLKTREQKSAALELATVYQTMEQEAEVQQQKAELHVRNLLLASAVAIILLLVVLLWRNIQYTRNIRKKNQIMVNTIDQLMVYKKEKREKPQQDDTPEKVLDNKTLFEKLDHIITTRKLYLERNITREELMVLIGVEKNRFGQILKEEAHTNITGYLNNLRLEYTVKLLKENPEVSIRDIAEKCAMPNTSTFYRVFRERYGMTPAEFREAQNCERTK